MRRSAVSENDNKNASRSEARPILANVFEDDESPKRRQLAGDQPKEKQKRSWFWIGLFMAIVTMSLSISVPVSIYLLRGTAFTSRRSSSSTRLAALIRSRLPSVSFDNPTSPESRALVWMIEVDTYEQDALPDDQLVQRFAMTAIGLSINGLESWLTGSPECSWGSFQVSCNPSGKIRRIVAGWNLLTGSIPVSIGLLTSMEAVALYHNNGLNGTIPSEVGGLTLLTQLSLGSNNLTGMIPTEIGGLTSLNDLSLYDNALTGTIPSEVGGLGALKELRLYRNRLNGTIPSEFGGLTSLTCLHLYSNTLTNTIPSEFGGLASLNELTLNINRLTGTIPSEVGSLTVLSWLDFGRNDFTGSIPVEMGGLTALRWMHLNNNTLTGTVPASVCQVVTPQIDCDEIVCECCRDSSQQQCP